MSQVANGKAFEYALAVAISRTNEGQIVQNKSYKGVKEYYDKSKNQAHLDRCASESAIFLQRNDTRLDDATLIRLQDDFKGCGGDVRDIVIGLNGNEVGISAKHNHLAIKHPRLSDRIDFGKKWGNYPVSKNYWNRVYPVFNDLRNRQEKGDLFKSIENKPSCIYLPILTAFEDELRRLCEDHGKQFILPFFQYLVGNQDYYKIVCSKDKVRVLSVNIKGTLRWGSRWRIPSRIQQVRRQDGSTSTLLVTFEHGWQLSFRLHNATLRVEPSLKFDIQFVGMQVNARNHDIPIRGTV